MTLEQTILDAVRTLSPERRRELLRFIDELRAKDNAREPRKDGYGILAHLGIRLSAEEINEARREMWAGFPRDDI